MSKKPHFFKSPVFLILLFIALSLWLYFAFDVQGEVREIVLTERHAWIAFGEKGGLAAFEISREKPPAAERVVPLLKKLPSDKVHLRVNVWRYPRLLLPSPVRKAAYEPPGITAGADLLGQRLFLVNPLSGIFELDITHLGTFTQTGSAPLAGAVHVAVQDERAFVSAGKRGLYVLNISRPGIPQLEYFLPVSGEARSAFLYETSALVKEVEVDASTGVQESSSEKEVKILRAYIACGRGGVKVLEIHPNLGFRRLEDIEVPGEANRVFAKDSMLYIAAGKAGLCTVPIFREGAQPVCRDTPGEALDVAVKGSHLYLADGRAGVRMYRLGTNPGDLSELGSFDLYGGASRLALRSSELLFVGSGEWGAALVDVSNPKKPRLRYIIETPGEADPALLLVSRINPHYDTPKVSATRYTLFQKAFIVAGMFVFLLAFLVQFVLPIRIDQRMQALSYVLYFLARKLERAIYVENGRMFRRDPVQKKKRAQILLVDQASAVLSVNSDNRVRILGPGVSFLRSNEKIARIVDLRPQSLIYGPDPDEDPFVSRRPSESDADYQARITRRGQTNAWTQDNVEICPSIIVDFQPRGRFTQGDQRWGFEPLAVYRLLTCKVPPESREQEHQGSPYLYQDHPLDYREIHTALPASDYLLCLERVVVRCWREEIRCWRFAQLFEPAVDANPSVPMDELPTGWLTAVENIRRALTGSRLNETASNDQAVELTGRGWAYRELEQAGLQILSVRIVNPRLPQPFEARLCDHWKRTWQRQAEEEKSRLDVMEEALQRAEQARARRDFGFAVSRFLYSLLQGQGRLAQRYAGPQETARRLLQGTLELRPLTPDQRYSIDFLLQRLRGK